MFLHDHGRLAAWAGAFIVLAAITSQAAAFLPPQSSSRLEIPLRQVDLVGYSSPEVALAKEQATEALSRRHGGTWRVYSWNPQTGTGSAIYGTGVQVASRFDSERELVAAARKFVAGNRLIFRADPANLRLISAPRVDHKWAVHFQQTYGGLDVVGGRVSLTFTDGGRLWVLGSEYYSGINLEPLPSVTWTMAQDLARRALPYNPATDSVEPAGTLVVLPVPLSATQVEYHLVWQVKVHTADPLGVWSTYVDGHSGQILARNNEVCFVDFTGTAQGLIERPSYCEGQTMEALPYLRVQIADVGSPISDATGHWSFPYAGTDAHSVVVDLYGPYVDLINNSGGQASFTGTATPGVPLTVDFNNGNARNDEKDVFQAVNDVHTFYETFAPGYSYTNRRMPAHVGVPGTCNAYWWNDEINFYNQGGGCANTGTIMGVVHHEFCHGITNNLLGGQGTQGIGEGNSDVLANLMTLESIIGRGFHLDNCSDGIRNSFNGLSYPGDVIGQEIHYAGQVIAGFHWDALQVLIAQFGTEQGRLIAATDWHNGRVLEMPQDQPAQVLATFIADDDDNDLTNGTPHYDAFCAGAINHGFGCPGGFLPVGACCVPTTGECWSVYQQLCPPPNVWQGEGTSCAPNPCPQPPTGACCNPEDGTCTMAIQVNCVTPRVWHPEWSSCAPNPCPLAAGACCASDGSCSVESPNLCAGVWYGPGSTCTPGLCSMNAGGVLFVHANTQLEWPRDGGYCGTSGIQSCDQAVTSVTNASPVPVVFFVLATFPETSSPRVTGVSFGADYDAAKIGLLGWGHCGDVETATDGWPAPGQGAWVQWLAPRTDRLTEVYWFAGYSYDGVAGTFGVMPHPQMGASIFNELYPNYPTPAACLGALGFNTAGTVCCSVPGACCLTDGSCVILSEPGCMAAAGEYQGGNTACEPDPCVSGDVLSGDGPVRAFALGAPAPNPSTGEVRFGLDLPAAMMVRIRLVDVTGKVLQTITEGTMQAGRHTLTATAAGGARLPSGIYYILAAAEGRNWSRRVVVLR